MAVRSLNLGMEKNSMFSLIWPMALLVLSNTVYQICTKSVPDGIDLAGAAICLIGLMVINLK